MYLPSLPAIAKGLHASPGAVQRDAGGVLRRPGHGPAGLWAAVGPDRAARAADLRRRRCSWSALRSAPWRPNVWLLVVARFLQALGGSAGQVMARALGARPVRPPDGRPGAVAADPGVGPGADRRADRSAATCCWSVTGGRSSCSRRRSRVVVLVAAIFGLPREPHPRAARHGPRREPDRHLPLPARATRASSATPWPARSTPAPSSPGSRSRPTC